MPDNPFVTLARVPGRSTTSASTPPHPAVCLFYFAGKCLYTVFCYIGQVQPWRSCTPLHTHTCCNMLSSTPPYTRQRVPYHTSLPSSTLQASVVTVDSYKNTCQSALWHCPRHWSRARTIYTADTRSGLYLHCVANRHGERRGAARKDGRRSGPEEQGGFSSYRF